MSALDSNFIRSMWRCDLSQTACARAKISESYPNLADVPLRALLLFPSTYLGLSTMFCMKTKFHVGQRKDDVLDMSLSKAVPRIEGPVLVKKDHRVVFSNTDFKSCVHSGCSFVVNKIYLTELGVECCFVCCNYMSL